MCTPHFGAPDVNNGDLCWRLGVLCQFMRAWLSCFAMVTKSNAIHAATLNPPDLRLHLVVSFAIIHVSCDYSSVRIKSAIIEIVSENFSLSKTVYNVIVENSQIFVNSKIQMYFQCTHLSAYR